MCGNHQNLLLLYILQSCSECKCSYFLISRSCWHLHFVELDNQQGRIVIFHLSCLLILCTVVNWSHLLLFSYMQNIDLGLWPAWHYCPVCSCHLHVMQYINIALLHNVAFETQALLLFFGMLFVGCWESFVPMEQWAPVRYDLPKPSSDPADNISSSRTEHPLALEPIGPQCNNERAENVPWLGREVAPNLSEQFWRGRREASRNRGAAEAHVGAAGAERRAWVPAAGDRRRR